jgi:C1A family cysteine protease
MLKRFSFLFTLLSVSVIALFVREAPVFAAQFSPAQLSPGFLEYTEAPEAWSGRKPSPVDLSHLSRVRPAMKSAKSDKIGDPLPGKYDLRQLGCVTAVDDQGTADNCWAFAAAGSMESGYLKRTGKTLNLSEAHLSWFAYEGTGSFTGEYESGGFDNVAVATLARWVGPVLGSAAPNGQKPGPASAYSDVLHLEDAYFLGLEFIDDPDLYLQPTDDVRKRLVYEHGAISAGMYSAGLGTDSLYYETQNNAWYYNGEKRYPDHAVLIVGWDDDYPRTNFRDGNQPSGNGAWLIKNSWGSGFGDAGYFWISYEDKSFLDGVAFVPGEPNNYDNNYGYDDLGWCISSGFEAVQTAWISNVFSAGAADKNGETIEAVSFYTTSNGVSYEISVYTALSDRSDPSGGTLASRMSGTQDLAGYHTVKLRAPAYISPDTSFSVVIKLTAPGYDYPVAVETQIKNYSDNAIIEKGVSFVSEDGITWSDASEYGANVCVKAFTKNGDRVAEDEETEEEEKPAEDGSARNTAKSGGGCSAGAAVLLPAAFLYIYRRRS